MSLQISLSTLDATNTITYKKQIKGKIIINTQLLQRVSLNAN